MHLEGLTEEEIAEMKAKSELEEFADAYKIRQDRF